MGNTRTAQFSDDGKRQLTWRVLLQPVQLPFFAMKVIWMRVCVNFRLVSSVAARKMFPQRTFRLSGAFQALRFRYFLLFIARSESASL